MADLNAVLWHERELLETLQFALESEQLMLASGRTRWLPRAAMAVEDAITSLRETEVLRAAEADAVASELGLPANVSLSALAQAADEPWQSIFTEQRDAFLAATTEISQVATTNREMLVIGQRATHEALLCLSVGGTTYTPDGATEAAGPRARLVDRSI
ncbi:MAG: flagellar protein FlgN [Nocardioidaceae bacterium]